MLFWKSMPVSDFGILASKMLAGAEPVPAAHPRAMLVTALIVFGGTTPSATLVTRRSPVPSILAMRSSSLGAGALVLSSPMVFWRCSGTRRSSPGSGCSRPCSGAGRIPLAFLIPGLVVLAENLFVRGFSNLITPADGLRGGQVLAYLRERSSFGLDERGMFENAMENGMALDITGMLNRFVAGIDWLQLGGGILVAVLLVFVASEYRRRVILT
jgi:ABC-2 type transport system permease protein